MPMRGPLPLGGGASGSGGIPMNGGGMPCGIRTGGGRVCPGVETAVEFKPELEFGKHCGCWYEEGP